MNSARIIRLFAISLILMIGIGRLYNTTNFFAAPSTTDQDNNNQKPPVRKHNPSTPIGVEQDKPEGQTSISVAVDLVSLQVLVTDSKGGTITGLKPENFIIYEDNVKQEISNFSPVDANLTVVMLVEYSNNVEHLREEIWDITHTFVNSLKKGDWVAVMGYDMNTRIICDFTQDRQKLNDALKHFMVTATYESNLSDALIEAIDRTQEIEGKTAILLIGTGWDTFSRHNYDQALNKCKESNASVYAIGIGQNYRIRNEIRTQTSERMEDLMGDNRLKSFADITGGAAYFPRFSSEHPGIIGNISEMLRSQYSIAYASSNTQKDGKYRKIRVEVNTGAVDAKGKPIKYKVTTRKGYIAKEF